MNEALDKVYAAQPARPAVWNGQRFTRLHWQRTRTALRTGTENLDPDPARTGQCGAPGQLTGSGGPGN